MARLFALFLLATSAAAQPIVTITSITPSSGPVTGGTVVTIHGRGFSDMCPPPITPCGRIAVAFGGVDALSSTVIDENTIQAITPPHFPGVVDVTRSQAYGATILPASFTYLGEVTDAFEPLLLPIFLPTVHGALGSIFFSEAYFWATAGPDIPVFGLSQPPCGDPFFCGSRPQVDLTILPTRGPNVHGVYQTGNPGLVVWVPKGAANRLSASLRVRDLSRSSQTLGTSIPIIPETDFRTELFALLEIPLSGNFRNALRIYSIDRGVSAHVRIVQLDGLVVYREFDLALRDSADLFHPAYAQFTDFQPDQYSVARIEIEPLTPGKRIWAFVSVTNNETQQITMIAPH